MKLCDTMRGNLQEIKTQLMRFNISSVFHLIKRRENWDLNMNSNQFLIKWQEEITQAMLFTIILQSFF